MRAVRVSIAVAAAAAFLVSRASTERPIAIELAPCHLELLAEEVQCGVHDVYEDREAGHGRRLAIQFAVLPALQPTAFAERFGWGWLAGVTLAAVIGILALQRRIDRDAHALESLARETGD